MNRVELFWSQIATARQENAEQIERARAKGRLLLIDDEAALSACAAFLESGETYPAASERGIWFPSVLLQLADGPDNPALRSAQRPDLITRGAETEEHRMWSVAPAWRTRGW